MKQPDPSGKAPKGFSADQWTAYQAIALGTSQREISKQIGKSSGTVARWVRNWRDEYGDDLFRRQAKANVDATHQNITPGNDESTSELAADWSARRSATAARHGNNADLAARVLDKFLTRLFEDDERLDAMTIADARWLEKIGSGSVATADRLSDLAHPDRKTRAGPLVGATQVNVDLGGLTTRAQEGNVIELRDRVVALKDSFERRRNSIETTETEAS